MTQILILLSYNLLFCLFFIFLQQIIIVRKIFALCLICASFGASAQNDSLPSETRFSGSVGVTNNGISIVPTFSLRAPAIITNLSLSKGGKFSIDPDIRFTFDFRKGSALLWFRYKLLNYNKFKFTVGAHPAFNFALRTVTENGKSWQITQARRFVATELAPTYIVNNHFAFGMYYLNGHGLQDDGPKSTHFVTFNTSFTGLPLGSDYVFNFNPNVYYLKVDKQDGFYLSGGASIANKKSPIAIAGSYNKEIRTNISGSRNFDWNITLLYKFNNKYKLIK